MPARTEKSLIIEIEVKFRWLITWTKFERQIRIPLPFSTDFKGDLAAVSDRGLTIAIRIE